MFVYVGIIPGKGKTVICVTYTPVDYTTAVMKLKVCANVHSAYFELCTYVCKWIFRAG